MFFQRMILLVALCWFTVSCSTGGYYKSTTRETNAKTGVRYLLGRDVPRNHEKAFYYFKKGAEIEQDPFAANELAFLYAAGKGTKQDYKQALIWYQKAAKQGLASAEYNLGLMYLYGLGTKINKNVGMAWIKQSATHGFMPAQNELDHLTHDTYPA